MRGTEVLWCTTIAYVMFVFSCTSTTAVVAVADSSSSGNIKKTMCGRRFVVDDTAMVDSTEGALSQARGFMGVAMVDDPAVVVFAGGIGQEGTTVVESSVDAFWGVISDPSDSSAENTVEREVLSLRIPRTDMGAGSTTRALFFAGGCGIDVEPEPPAAPDADLVGDVGQGLDTPTDPKDVAVGDEGLRDATVAEADPAGADTDASPLSVRYCKPTDVVDVFAPAEGSGDDGVSLITTDGVRLCEPKYAASAGVFFAGDGDDGDPSSWSPTAYIMVAGGIVQTGEGQYTATDTVDILREDGIDPDTGKVIVTNLQVQRLPNPPRFEMTSSCFKHQCVFAGGRVSMGDGDADFYSDRVDVWDGSTWSFDSWGEHILSEPRNKMGSAVVEITIDGTKTTVGLFVGGVSNAGNSPTVDLFSYDDERMLPRMSAPTISGPTHGVSLSRSVAAFVSETGKIDVFDGETLCWTSYEAEGFSTGTSAVGRSPAWFFNATSPGFRETGGVDGDGVSVQESSAFVGGGVAGASGGDVSREVHELRWRSTKGREAGGAEDDVEACLGGRPLRQVSQVCGLPGPMGGIRSFTPGAASGSGHLRGSHRTGTAGAGNPASGDRLSGGNRVGVYILAALVGISVSYLISASLILRKIEGLWRLPFGGGVVEGLCEWLSNHCCRCPERRNGNGRARNERSHLVSTNDVESGASRPIAGGALGTTPPVDTTPSSSTTLHTDAAIPSPTRGCLKPSSPLPEPCRENVWGRGHRFFRGPDPPCPERNGPRMLLPPEEASIAAVRLARELARGDDGRLMSDDV